MALRLFCFFFFATYIAGGFHVSMALAVDSIAYCKTHGL